MEFLLLWSSIPQYPCSLKLLPYNVTNEGLNSKSLVRNVEEPHLCFILACFNAEEYITSLNMMIQKEQS